ncbi:UNKNOWN [Stylonychia lemnae]|uniref:Uncharacterized protein n=1 Tax=Stylonychia lemnae TaxID=5949 RepID=A0A078ACH4_STYLE|nr:UNKNOWN [Stylonychia lemnae]|eukprot:CDW78533.1 UNKNOWN [Stylonychia lemnae]
MDKLQTKVLELEFLKLKDNCSLNSEDGANLCEWVSCGSDSQCSSGLCYDSECREPYPGWLKFLIIFFGIAVLSAIVIICFVKRYKRETQKQKLFIYNQQQIEIEQSRQEEQQQQSMLNQTGLITEGLNNYDRMNTRGLSRLLKRESRFNGKGGANSSIAFTRQDSRLRQQSRGMSSKFGGFNSDRDYSVNHISQRQNKYLPFMTSNSRYKKIRGAGSIGKKRISNLISKQYY